MSRSPKLALTDTRPDAQARGEVELAGDQGEQVVAGDGQPDLGLRVVAVGEVDDGAVVQPAVEGHVQVADVAGERPVEVDPGRRRRVAASRVGQLLAAPAGTLHRGHASSVGPMLTSDVPHGTARSGGRGR